MLVAVALAGPMVALVFLPSGSMLALIIGVAVTALLLLAAIALAPVVSVTSSTFRAGRAHIDIRYLGEPQALTGEAARHARGAGLPAHGWHLIKGGIDGIVVVPNIDIDDPVDYWTVSSRTPDRLAAALSAARR